MKKLLIFVTITFCAIFSNAQVPNNGFESWISIGNYSVPDQWGTLNPITNFDNVYTSLQGSPGNPGNSYLMLLTQSVTGLGIVPGMAATGTINSANYSVNGGFPYTQRPQYLSGFWQFMPFSGNDFGFVSIYLTKWNMATNVRDTISATVYSLAGMEMSWSPFSIFLNYQMSTYPDTAQIILSASGISNPASGDYLYVDELILSGTVSGVESFYDPQDINFYPNPVKDYLNVIFKSPVGQMKIELSDITGKKIETLYSNNVLTEKTKHIFDFRNIKKGIYIIQFDNSKSSIVRKIVVTH